jgi:hypothetical protein
MRAAPLRIVQANPSEPERAIEAAWAHGCDSIAWDLRQDCHPAVHAASAARLRSEGWYAAARDPEASVANPRWMHSPRSHAWLGSIPGEAQVVAPYIGLNNKEAFDYARARLLEAIFRNSWCTKLWLSDIQGPPNGCGCGHPGCRAWDDSLGEKVVTETPAEWPESFFPEIFFEAVMQNVWVMDRPIQVSPVLCPGCECGFSLAGIPNPDGPRGTNLCRSAASCAIGYWPELLQRFIAWNKSLFVPQVGLLLMCDALQKNHPVYGEPRSWPVLASAHYGNDLFPCVEPADSHKFESCMVVLDAPQDSWAVPAPADYGAPQAESVRTLRAGS